MTSLAAFFLVFFASEFAGQGLLVDGYWIKCSDAIHHPPAEHYLSIEPEYDVSPTPDLLEWDELQKVWWNVASQHCGPDHPKAIYGPLRGQDLPEYCEVYPDEEECRLGIWGYFHCTE